MILVVDDTPANIDIILAIIGERDDIAVALDGEEALEVITEDERPDLVLLDIMMPGIDGFEVCRQIKATPVLKEIPVVFLSGNSNEAERKKAEDLNAAGFLSKPIDPEKLISYIEKYSPLPGPTGSGFQ